MIQKGNFRANLELRSINAATNDEVITFVHTHERSATHAEMMTHRVSRNASSARAIPRKRMDEWTQKDPAMPLHIGTNKPGMQAGAEVKDVDIVKAKIQKFYQISRKFANHLYDVHDVHKEICNRFDETFAWINVVSTWSKPQFYNYVALRCTPYAEARIQRLAINMLREYKASEPQVLKPGDWHMPFVKDKWNYEKDGAISKVKCRELDCFLEGFLIWSTARAAWVSYRTVEEKDATWELAKKRHDDCTTLKHVTPVEHQAVALADRNLSRGSLRGYQQYRHMIAGEMTTDVDIDAILALYDGKDFITA